MKFTEQELERQRYANIIHENEQHIQELEQRAEAAEQQCKAQSDALAEFREESVVLARLVNISGVLNASGTEKMREQARRVLELEKKL